MTHWKVARRWLLAALCIGALAAAAASQLPTGDIEDTYFESNGARIRYVDFGHGEPIVLIHAFGANLDLNWRRSGLFYTLARDFRVVALDCRGHGKSDKPHDVASYGSQMAADIRNLLDHLRIPRAHVVGYSMGGDIALQFAALYPARVSTLTFGGTGAVRSWTDEQARAADELASSLEQGKGLRPLILRMLAPNEPPPTDMAVTLASREILSRNDPLALAAAVRGRREQVVDDEHLKALRMPLLAIVGSADPNLRGVQELKELLPDLKLVVIKGATHVGPPRGAPARPEFAAAVHEFIAAHPSGAGH